MTESQEKCNPEQNIHFLPTSPQHHPTFPFSPATREPGDFFVLFFELCRPLFQKGEQAAGQLVVQIGSSEGASSLLEYTLPGVLPSP